MPPRELTADEQALVDKWVPWAVFFMKMLRRANKFLATVPKELYTEAYKEASNSKLVTGAKPRDTNDKSSEDYVQCLKDLVERHPITSSNNAATVLFAGNDGSTFVDGLVFMHGSERAIKEYQAEVRKLNNADLSEARENEEMTEGDNHGSVKNNANVNNSHFFARDPDDRAIDNPFIRLKPTPDTKLSKSNWQQYEKVGQTFFVGDDDDETGYTAFELAGISIRRTGHFYRLCYEENVDWFEITREEFLRMIEDGMWV